MRIFDKRSVRARVVATLLLFMTGMAPSFATGEQNDLSQRLQALLRSNRQRYGIAGQALVVMHDGKVIFSGVDGQIDIDSHRPVKNDSVFPAFSISKLFVSTLIMQLADQGRLDLGRPASEYVTGLPERWKRISVRDFLDHTSGIPEYFGSGQGEELTADTRFPPDITAVLASLANAPLQFVPGTETRYTQTNYLVLSALLAAYYGKPYPQVVQERIIRPLQLKHTWLGPSDVPQDLRATAYTGKNGRLQKDAAIAWPSYAYGHAELYTTASDLAHFMPAVASGKLVSQATLQRSWQPRELSTGQRGWFATGWDYGESHGYHEVGHDGGARSRVRIIFKEPLDERAYIIVYLTNGSAKNVWSRTLVDAVMQTVAPAEFPASGHSGS